jgi:TolB-like protein/Flp pilus assembly protein TadD
MKSMAAHPMSGLNNSRIRFGDCEIDAASFELCRDGRPCAVEPQVLELLLYLARNPGRLVTKSDLIENVWGGRIVSDSTLASRIKSARRAIGDDGAQQKLIRTVHGRGVRFVAAVRAEGAAFPEADGAPQASPRPAIAVLPFANLGGDAAQAYFSDGLTEDIIVDLARFRLFRVAARGASFRFRDERPDPQRVGRELAVDYIVTGSLRRQDRNLRFCAELTETRTGNQLWTECYDRDTEDLFAVADDLVRTVAATLAGRAQAAGSALARRKPPANLAAYECVLRAHAGLAKLGDLQAEAESRRLFEQALELDAGYARAHVGLAIILLRAWFRGAADAGSALDRSLAHAERAVALDGDDHECQETLGWVLLHRRAFESSEQHYRRAIELNPNSPHELAAMGSACSYFGRPDEGIEWLERAKRVDPYFDAVWYWHLLGAAYFNARRYEDALAAFGGSARPPLWVKAYMAASHALAGRVERARGLAADIAQAAPGFSGADLAMKEPYKDAKDREHLMAGLRLADLLPETGAAGCPPAVDAEADRCYRMGRSFFLEGGWGKRALEVARQLLVQAIASDPGHARAYAALASCDCHRLLLGVPDISFATIVANSRRALELEPDLPDAYAAEGLVHFAAGRKAEANAAFERAVELGPESFDAHFFHGRNCLVHGLNEKAAQLFERAALLNPNDFAALGLLVDAYRVLGRPDDSMAAARRCVERARLHIAAHPDNANALAYAAIVAAELGERDLARDWAMRAMAIDPDDIIVNYNLACAYGTLGEPEIALDRLRRAVPDDPFGRRALAEWIEMDTSIDSLRHLPEFRHLVAALEPAAGAGARRPASAQLAPA